VSNSHYLNKAFLIFSLSKRFQEALDKAMAISETKTQGNIKYNLEIVPGK